MNKKNMTNTILIVLLIILAAVPQSTFPASADKYTITLKDIGVAFDLPKAYSILQQEIVDGRYATVISFGKEFRPRHLKSIDLQLRFWPTAHDGWQNVPGYTPSQYVDVEFKQVKEGHEQNLPGYHHEPEHVTLFGNKAIRYVYVGFLCCVSLVGYLRADQLSGRAAREAREYLVRIETGGVDDDATQLFDALPKSLRTTK